MKRNQKHFSSIVVSTFQNSLLTQWFKCACHHTELPSDFQYCRCYSKGKGSQRNKSVERQLEKCVKCVRAYVCALKTKNSKMNEIFIFKYPNISN